MEINGHVYAGENDCATKKEAEQAAAKQALEQLLNTNLPRTTQRMPSPPSSVSSSNESSNKSKPYERSISPSAEVESTKLTIHFPQQYADIEEFITTKVGKYDGRIHKIWPADLQGRFKVEIGGSYRYCDNVRRHHKKNHVYFIINPKKRTYFQRCHDPECYGFQSAIKYMDKELGESSKFEEKDSTDECEHCHKSLKNESEIECERCGGVFCFNCVCVCELCHDAMHCERCFESCFDCHDS